MSDQESGISVIQRPFKHDGKNLFPFAENLVENPQFNWKEARRLAVLPISWNTLKTFDESVSTQYIAFNSVFAYISQWGRWPDPIELFGDHVVTVHLELWGLPMASGQIIPFLSIFDEQGQLNTCELNLSAIRSGEQIDKTAEIYRDQTIPYFNLPQPLDIGNGFVATSVFLFSREESNTDYARCETTVLKKNGRHKMEYEIDPITQEIMVNYRVGRSRQIVEMRLKTNGIPEFREKHLLYDNSLFQRNKTTYSYLYFNNQGELTWVQTGDRLSGKSQNVILREVNEPEEVKIRNLALENCGIPFDASTTLLDSSSTIRRLFENINSSKPVSPITLLTPMISV